jgi:hypothetical protein
MSNRSHARDRAIGIAKAMIGGRRSLVRGVRDLARLRGHICQDPLSPTLLAILVAADDTRDLELDRSTHLQSRDAADDLSRRIEDLTNRHRDAVLTACRALVRKLERG